MRLGVLAGILLISLIAAPAPLAQIGLPGLPGQTPARDTTRIPVGTATVSGVVLTADSPGRPLRRALVSLQSADLRAPISAVTDDDGRFVLSGVVAGHYTVMAARPGYVNTILGAAPGTLLGSPVAVGDGQQVTGLSIRMPRGGVITGAVRFQSGRPARNVQIQISPIRTIDGQRRGRFTPGLGVVTTDDRGVYRQFDLPPGDYVVQMMSGGPVPQADAIRQTTADEVAWADRLATTRAAAGAPPAAGEPGEGRVVLPAPIYYPGTTDLATARLITIGPGEERAGIDLVVEYVPTARVSGRVIDPDGRPQNGATVRLNSKGGSSSIADMMGALIGRGVRTDENGVFEIDAVPPGEYTLSTQAVRPGDAPKPGGDASQTNIMTMFSGMFGRGGGAGSLHAAAPVVVSGQDVSNLEMRLGDGSSVSGTVVFEGSAPRPSPAAMQVMLVSPAQSASPVELAMSMAQGASAPVSADLTFSLKGVVPNRYRATVNMPGAFFGTAMPNATWTVKSIRGPNGADIADVPFEVEPGRSVEGIVVTLTDQPSVVSGRVLDQQGRPSSAFPIVIFSTNTAHWTAGSRRVQQVRPASDGTYRIAGLPAGEYYVGAVTTFELEDLYEPSFLQQIVPIAFRITIADGEKKEQDLRIGG